MAIHRITTDPDKLREMLGKSDAEPGWPDETLGRFLLGVRVIAEADRYGIHPQEIPEELATDWVKGIADQEADNVADIPLEKALRAAANGEFAKAGRIFRAFMWDGAQRMVDKKFAVVGVKRTRQASEFGRRGSAENKAEGEANRQSVLVAAKEILAERVRKPSDRDLARLIEEKIDMPSNTVRGHLTKLRKEKKLD